eukprot:gene9564-biopygen12234
MKRTCTLNGHGPLETDMGHWKRAWATWNERGPQTTNKGHMERTKGHLKSRGGAGLQGTNSGETNPPLVPNRTRQAEVAPHPLGPPLFWRGARAASYHPDRFIDVGPHHIGCRVVCEKYMSLPYRKATQGKMNGSF